MATSGTSGRTCSSDPTSPFQHGIGRRRDKPRRIARNAAAKAGQPSCIHCGRTALLDRAGGKQRAASQRVHRCRRKQVARERRGGGHRPVEAVSQRERDDADADLPRCAGAAPEARSAARRYRTAPRCSGSRNGRAARASTRCAARTRNSRDRARATAGDSGDSEIGQPDEAEHGEIGGKYSQRPTDVEGTQCRGRLKSAAARASSRSRVIRKPLSTKNSRTPRWPQKGSRQRRRNASTAPS